MEKKGKKNMDARPRLNVEKQDFCFVAGGGLVIAYNHALLFFILPKLLLTTHSILFV